MPSTPEHEDLYTYRKRSVLPPDAQTAVYELGQAVENRSITTTKISKFRDALKTVPASAVPRASAEIREIAGIYQGYHQPEQPTGLLAKFLTTLKPKSPITDALRSHSDIGWLLIFHGNGYVRQAALEALSSTPHSEFEFSAIVYRLNDWVENIRYSAAPYAKSFFPKTHPAIVGQSAFFLLAQARVLSRWNRDGQVVLEDTIYRPDVLEYLKVQFLSTRSGRVGHTIQQILKRPDFDTRLSELARNAALPSVRAVAMDALLNNRARWFVGYKKQWIDKVFSISRRVADFETRSVDLHTDFDGLLVAAASDKSAQVRKVAADTLNANLDGASEKMDKVAETLQHDKNSSVRSRIDFYMRKRKAEE